jgi:hypothetical protein
MTRVNERASEITDAEFERHGGAPCSHLGIKARKLKRVPCSSLVDWPVYPRLRGLYDLVTFEQPS